MSHNAVTVPADKLAELQREAARYRWLRDGKHTRQTKELRDRGGRQIDKNPMQALVHFSFWCSPEELDAAIDAAMTDGVEGGGDGR